MKVVGTMFFENEKLLIDKPRKRPTYQMIGGKVEDGETTLQAAIRECHEELGDEAIFDEEKFELIMCIINAGFSDAVMDAARSCGARGGTVIHARGTARQEVETRFNISIHPEKEVVLILASNKIKDDILHAIYQEVGLNSPGQGIAFSMPVDEVVGINNKKTEVAR